MSWWFVFFMGQEAYEVMYGLVGFGQVIKSSLLMTGARTASDEGPLHSPPPPAG